MKSNINKRVITPLVITALALGGLYFQGVTSGDLQTSIFNIGKSPKATPDLESYLEVIEADNQKITVRATITNVGKGDIESENGLDYRIDLNGQEVLATSDFFTEFKSQSSFSFNYDIPRKLFLYPRNGYVGLELDINDKIKETSEVNNYIRATYELKLPDRSNDIRKTDSESLE